MTAPSAAAASHTGLTSKGAKVCFSLGLVVVVGTYVAAQVDFWRRHKPGLAPEIYLWPQLLQIWLPGVGLALALGALGFALHRRHRKAVLLPSHAGSN